MQACGVCHSDVLTKEGMFPGIQYPRVPGHEVAGVVDEVGAGVSGVEKGAACRASAGTAVTMAPVASAGAAIFAIAVNVKIPGHQL